MSPLKSLLMSTIKSISSLVILSPAILSTREPVSKRLRVEPESIVRELGARVYIKNQK